jgi:hypothetical protein
VTKKRARIVVGKAPSQHVPRLPPKQHRVGAVPRRDAASRPPVGKPTRVPDHAPPAGKVPNPKKPKLVRDVHGGTMGDLFQFFPDLPRPARARPRVRAKVGSPLGLRKR